MGAELFERNTRAASLTAAGLSFPPHARKIIGELDLARRAATTETGRFYGRLGIGLSGALNHKTLPPLTRARLPRYRELELTLSVGLLTQDAMNLLGTGSQDLPFVGPAGGLPVPSHPAYRDRTARSRITGGSSARGQAVRALAELAGRIRHHARRPGFRAPGGHVSCLHSRWVSAGIG